jgi:hypothetical protein
MIARRAAFAIKRRLFRAKGLDSMADHAQSAVELGGIVDVADHERTYNGFLTLVKWGTIAVAVLVALLFIFVFY